MMKVPIIFIIYNRPSLTKIVFSEIAKYKPNVLYVVADGPKNNNSSNIVNCRKTRAIIDGVNWKCKVIKDYSNTNQGCKKRVSSGISNAFKIIDRAIILEDDCVPNEDFFSFCEQMLEKFQDDTRVMTITGDNYLFNKQACIGKDSYYFSRYPNIWGWATWKRAWNKYDIEMKKWPLIKREGTIPKTWYESFNKAYNNKVDTWDVQWVYCCLINGGLTVVPKVNLVKNIGFSISATHTKMKTIVSEMKTQRLSFPLIHPGEIKVNEVADKISRFHFTKIGIVIDIIKSFLCQKS